MPKTVSVVHGSAIYNPYLVVDIYPDFCTDLTASQSNQQKRFVGEAMNPENEQKIEEILSTGLIFSHISFGLIIRFYFIHKVFKTSNF